MMRASPPRRIAFLVALATLLAAPVAPARQEAALEQARAALDAARDEKERAAEALEALVFELKDDYLALTVDPQAASNRHALVLAMLDSLESARTRIAAEGAGGRAVLRGRRRQILNEVFEAVVTRASPVDPRFSAWVARRLAESLSARDDLEGIDADALLARLDALFPSGRTWYQFWNESFHKDLPEAREWQSALLAYEAAGLALDRLLQPERYGAKGEVAPPGMVVVPGGSYSLGPNTGWQRPARRVSLKVFAIDRHEVTQGEYALYVNALPPGQRSDALPRGWSLDEKGLASFDDERRDHPVIFVSWGQAAGYAAWAGKRLPTEDEWEAAAAGTEGLVHPWGDEFLVGMANGDGAASGTLPVEAFPSGRSPIGCFDMSGNAWEWTATLEDGRDVETLPEGLVNAIIRGGGWDSRRDELTTRYRRGALAHDTFAPSRYKVPVGFRCVKDL